MSTIIREDSELLESLESSRLCLPLGEDCDREADWLIVKICCGSEIPLCEEHAAVVREWLDRNMKTMLTCVNCKAERLAVEGLTWMKL